MSSITGPVSIIGAGTMGNGIAHVFAQHDFEVRLIDTSEKALARAIQTITKNLDRQLSKGIITESVKDKAIANIQTFASIADGVKDSALVIEAATEKVDIKLKIFKEIDEAAPSKAILATNTSSISITKIAAITKRPGSVIGMHFMNPVPVMKLVEIINGYSTEKKITDTIVALSKELGKSPCVVNDFPGFIANRILMPMINEAIIALYEGVAGVEEIDTIMKSGMAHPMGPLQLADFIGLDICLSILEVLYNGFGNPKYAPCPLLINMVAAGKTGFKTGEGFYFYQPNQSSLIVSERFRKALS